MLPHSVTNLSTWRMSRDALDLAEGISLAAGDIGLAGRLLADRAADPALIRSAREAAHRVLRHCDELEGLAS